jgi:hypothetical protein
MRAMLSLVHFLFEGAYLGHRLAKPWRQIFKGRTEQPTRKALNPSR